MPTKAELLKQLAEEETDFFQRVDTALKKPGDSRLPPGKGDEVRRDAVLGIGMIFVNKFIKRRAEIESEEE